MDIKTSFGSIAQSYDGDRGRLIPCFTDLYTLPLQLIRIEAQRPRLLDLGAGTGLFSAVALEKYPDAQLTLVDLSGDMLSVARQRFAGADATYLESDFCACEFDRPFDGVISALAIHHLPDMEKRALYEKIYGWLAPGGVFINIDQVKSPSAHVEQLIETLRDELLDAAGLSPEALAAAKKRLLLDDPSTVSGQLGWLRDAGFADADCIYKYCQFATLYARK